MSDSLFRTPKEGGVQLKLSGISPRRDDRISSKIVPICGSGRPEVEANHEREGKFHR